MARALELAHNPIQFVMHELRPSKLINLLFHELVFMLRMNDIYYSV